MASQTTVCNMALSHLAISKQIASLVENSTESRACSLFYETARQAVLRDFSWPFATAIVTLALVTDNSTNPAAEWAYSYRYPSDCIEFRRILSGQRRDDSESRVPFRIVGDSGGRLILTDMINAQAEYGMLVNNEDFYPSDFTLALSLRLAAYLAPQLTAGDQFKLGARAMQLYTDAISKARANAMDEQQGDQDPESEFMRARY